MADPVKVNGTVRSGTSVRIKHNGKPYYGVTEIDYGVYERDVVHNYAFGENPYSASFGNIIMSDCTVTMFRASAVALVQDILSASDKVESLLDIAVSFLKTPKEGAQNDTLEKCIIKNIHQVASASTPEALTMVLIFLPMRVKLNGSVFEIEK